jgi:hypothetical protein
MRQAHRERKGAASDAGIGRVECGTGHSDEHLALPCRGLLGVLVAQDLGSAEFVETYCLHDGLLSLIASNVKHLLEL